MTSPNIDPDPPKGVMDDRYAADRVERPELVFRLKYRALAAATAFARYRVGAHRPHVLDLGAADGATMREVAEQVDAESAMGIEYSEGLIRACPSLPEHCALQQGDVYDVEELVGGRQFDLVLALALLEHLADPGRLVQSVHHVLRPGGLFIASCPSGFWDAVSGRLGLHKAEHHEIVVTKRVFHSLVQAPGWRAVEYRPFMFVPVAMLPYLGVSISPVFAQRVDDVVRRVKVLDATFVNQLFVARKEANGVR